MRARLRWNGNRLYLDGELVGQIIPADEEGLWQIVLPDGSLSDMAAERSVAKAEIMRQFQPGK